MLMIQETLLPPDVEYFLDAALEQDELDAASHYALKLYGSRSAVSNIVDQTFDGGSSIRNRVAISDNLTLCADGVLALMEPDKRAAVLYAGMRHLKNRTTSLAEIIADWAIEDMVVGGALKPFVRNSKWANRHTPSPKMRRRLYSPKWAKRFVVTHLVTGTVDPVTLRGPQLVARCRGIDLAGADETSRIIQDEMRIQREAYRAVSNRMARRYLADALKPKTEPRKQRRARRRVIRRSAGRSRGQLGTIGGCARRSLLQRCGSRSGSGG